LSRRDVIDVIYYDTCYEILSIIADANDELTTMMNDILFVESYDRTEFYVIIRYKVLTRRKIIFVGIKSVRQKQENYLRKEKKLVMEIRVRRGQFHVVELSRVDLGEWERKTIVNRDWFVILLRDCEYQMEGMGLEQEVEC